MRRPTMPVLRNSAGAFDLPSIITGVVVVGIMAAGVLAAIFGVIPFAQDRGAKQDLSSIRTAEGVAKAKDNRFMDHQGLLDVGYLQLSSTEKTKVKADAKGTCYVAVAKSGTGKVFYLTDSETEPRVLSAGTISGCLPGEAIEELINEVGGIAAPSAAPVPVPEPAHNTFANPGFEQGFEGWTKHGSFASLWTGKHSGVASVHMSDIGQRVSQTVMVPAGQTKLTFWYRQAATGTPVELYVNGARTGSAIAPAKDTWTRHTVDLSSYAGKRITVGFGGGSIFNPVHLDDVALEVVTVADAPTTAAASSREGTATVTWASSFSGGIPTTSYTVSAWLNGKVVDTVTVAADKRTATLAGVKTGTSYAFTVAANNAVGTSKPSPATALVPVHDGAVANPGFEQGFEGWTKHGSFASLWTGKHSGVASVQMSDIGQRVSQTVMVPADQTKLTFWYRQAYTGTPVELYVNGARTGSAIAPAKNTWTRHTVDLSAYAGKRITVGFGGGSISNPVHLDDVALESNG